MSEYEEKTVKPLRRKVALAYLAKCQSYTSNADVILSVINGTRDGVTAYYSDVVDDLNWLETNGFVKLSGEDIIVVETTKRGLRVASGDDRHPGIARPAPKA